jgi:hypothetical protein
MGVSQVVANLRPLHLKPLILMRNVTVHYKRANSIKTNKMTVRKTKMNRSMVA